MIFFYYVVKTLFFINLEMYSKLALGMFLVHSSTGSGSQMFIQNWNQEKQNIEIQIKLCILGLHIQINNLPFNNSWLLKISCPELVTCYGKKTLIGPIRATLCLTINTS